MNFLTPRGDHILIQDPTESQQIHIVGGHGCGKHAGDQKAFNSRRQDQGQKARQGLDRFEFGSQFNFIRGKVSQRRDSQKDRHRPSPHESQSGPQIDPFGDFIILG